MSEDTKVALSPLVKELKHLFSTDYLEQGFSKIIARELVRLTYSSLATNTTGLYKPVTLSWDMLWHNYSSTVKLSSVKNINVYVVEIFNNALVKTKDHYLSDNTEIKIDTLDAHTLRLTTTTPLRDNIKTNPLTNYNVIKLILDEIDEYVFGDFDNLTKG